MKKKNLVLGFMLIMLLAFSTSLMAVGYSGGGGIEANPYIIDCLVDLQELQDTSADWGKYFIQVENIDASATSSWVDVAGAGWTPIGFEFANSFTGSYNGLNHTINGLYINRAVSAALFGFTKGATLQNIALTNVNITGGDYTGGLVGRALYSNISNCSSTGTVTTSSDKVGGLIGELNGSTLTNSNSSCTVSGAGYVGGLFGIPMSSGSVSNSYATGNVTATGQYAGGFCGITQTITINNCYSTGNVTGSTHAGGFVGQVWSGATVTNSYSYGNVSGTDNLGGFIGMVEGTVSDCYSRGNVTRSSGSSEYAGSFTGYMLYSGAAITKSYCTGSVYYTDTDDPENKGFIGSFGGGTATDNFFDEGVSKQTDGNGATAKTTEQMKTESLTGWGWSAAVWERIGYNYPRLIDNPDPTLPVTLSTFTAQFIENTPTLYWTTQSETDNMGWFVYRSSEENFTTSEKISEFLEGHGTTTQQQSYIYEDTIENPEIGDTYYYWLESIDYSGVINHYDRVAILTIPHNSNSGNNLVPAPERFGLLQNEPNPLVSSTRISFNLPETARVDLNVYNIKGQLVRSLYSGFALSKTIQWDGKDESGKVLESGMYFYKLMVNGKTAETKKLILMR
ncbi:MAG: GLUG motif-containing protein [Candidatus Celaenobacter antarcticus]|nr:GLUG motif-containing protein [Candidatus Celaenobacter antarcticus]